MNQGRSCFELSGDADELQLWQKDDSPSVIIANIQSAGVGVDLTRACYGYFYSCGFSHPNYDQACRRLDRPGQTRPVTIYRAIANNTVDEAVAASLEAKGNTIGAAIDYLRGKYETLTTEIYE
jgi:SNF2 family DNA or RNA helicase